MNATDPRSVCVFTLLFIALADACILFGVPALSQILGFVLLTFLPGFLLIRIARFTKDPLENVFFNRT